MKKIFTYLTLFCICCSFITCKTLAQGAGKTETITSPDEQIVVTVSDTDGKPTYTIELGGEVFIAPSQLGLETNIQELWNGMSLTDKKEEKISETYEVKTIKQSKVKYEANKAVLTFSKEKCKVLDVEFRVSNRDVAFRYTIYSSKDDILAAVVKDEKTTYNFVEGTTTFIAPQMTPMGGYAGTAPSYETQYSPDAAMGKNGEGYGFTYPCLFHNGKKGWILISETGLTSEYCGTKLTNDGGSSYKVSFPDPKENDGIGSATPGISMPYTTPWRTITLGKTLAPIMETTVTWDVVSEQYPASKNFTYGSGTWSWIIKSDESCTFDEQKNYVDFAAAMGYQTVLVDALWDVQIGYDKIEELAKYAEGKGVALYLWYNSNGYWNHAPVGPRNKMHRAVVRKKEMAWLKKIGIRGLKIDFWGGDKQQTIQLYEDILSDANDYGLNVIFHGSTIPRGWEKMYPNFIACEAVRASENLRFNQFDCDTEAFSATLHPFIRNSLGTMDFGGSVLNKRWGANNNSGNTRKTSDVFQLATAIIFQSPVQHFALAPNNLKDAPEWAIDFMKKVPTLWDEVKYIDGYPGKYVIMARKTGDKWYIAGVNAEDSPKIIDLQLANYNYGDSFTLYRDDGNLSGSVNKVEMDINKNCKVTIPKNGGFVIMPNEAE